MALTMSPALMKKFVQNLRSQGRGILGGAKKTKKKCPKGSKVKKVSFKACKKGKGIVLGGCECCMGEGCMNCMGSGMIGGKKRNAWVSCLKKLHNVKKCQSQKKRGYPVLKRKTKPKPKKKVNPKAKKALSAYQRILNDVRMDNPSMPFRMAQKKASELYHSGNSVKFIEPTDEFISNDFDPVLGYGIIKRRRSSKY